MPHIPSRRARALAALTAIAASVAPSSPGVATSAAADSSGDDLALEGPAPSGVVGAELRSAYPGLYLPDSLAVRNDGDGFVVRSTLPCRSLETMFAAGDFRAVSQLDVPPEAAAFAVLGALTPMLVLASTDGVAAVAMTDRADGCRAVLTRGTVGDVVLDFGQGAATSRGWTVATRCLDTGDLATVSVAVDRGDGSGASAMLHVVFDPRAAAEPGGTEASLDESVDSIGASGDLDVLEMMTTMLAAAVHDGGGEPVVPVGTSMWTASSSAAGNVELEPAGDVELAGTITLDGVEWTDADTGASVSGSASVPFRCGTVTTLA